MSEEPPSGAAAPRAERVSPLVRTVALLVGFAALVVVAVFTVVLPELRDEPGSAQSGEPSPTVTAKPAAPAPGAP